MKRWRSFFDNFFRAKVFLKLLVLLNLAFKLRLVFDVAEVPAINRFLERFLKLKVKLLKEYSFCILLNKFFNDFE